MSVDRIKRVNILLQHEIANGIYHVLRPDEIDISAITITRVSTSRNLRQAKVMISIREHEDERDHMLGILRKHRKDFQDYICKSIVLKYTPRVFFSLDTSIEKGNSVLDTLSHLDIPKPPAEDDEPHDERKE